jgi:hypothetical protein
MLELCDLVEDKTADLDCFAPVILDKWWDGIGNPGSAAGVWCA